MNTYLKNKLLNLNESHCINNDILNLILNLFSNIEENKIDKEKTTILFKDNELSINLCSNQNESIPITILIWKNVINLYIGSNLIQYTDDLFIRNKDDLDKFEKHFLIWLNYEIEEVLNTTISKFRYSNLDNNIWKPFYYNVKDFNSIDKNNLSIKTIFKRWI